MTAIRIRKTIDSETLTLPELKPLIGRTVDIVIEEQVPSEALRKEFWDFAAINPATEVEYTERRKIYEHWRTDPRFQPWWSTIDHVLNRTWEETREWQQVLEATQGLQDYDFDALPEMDAASLKDQAEMWS